MHLHRGLPLAGHEDGKTAAALVLGDDDLDAHLGEDVDHGAADVAEDVVRGAAVEIEHLRLGLARLGRDDFGNRVGKGLLVERRDALHGQGAGLELRSRSRDRRTFRRAHLPEPADVDIIHLLARIWNIIFFFQSMPYFCLARQRTPEKR